MSKPAEIVHFPSQGRQPEGEGGLWASIRDRLSVRLGTIAQRLGIPGGVQDCEFTDELTGQHVLVHVGPLFTRISVNGRDYYFSRWSGKCDGSGSGCT